MQSSNKASEGFFKSMKESGYLPESVANKIDGEISSDSFKHSSTADKAAYWDTMKSFMGQSIQNTFKNTLSAEESSLKSAEADKSWAMAELYRRKGTSAGSSADVIGSAGDYMDRPMSNR
jgi:hypothetical protein